MDIEQVGLPLTSLLLVRVP